MAHSLLPLPKPRQAIEIVSATLDDVGWIDDLQKRHRDRVGFQTRGAIEGKIKLGEIIVARTTDGMRVGYCMASDRYMKREDVGVIYQMNVEPGHQRGFVGAALLAAQFERSAYGCRLYCCWCAQDIEANRFWEAMGFVPLAYRAGSEKKQRVHIFWQKRIREGDRETPWWFPSQTKGGCMSDRLVLPIPPGTHWSDAKPIILPGAETAKLEGPKPKQIRSTRPNVPLRPGPLCGGLSFAPAAPAKPDRIKAAKVKQKNDPKLVAAARELRDRWLEHVNAGERLLENSGKYDVSRSLAAPVATLKQLVAPAA